MKIAVFRGLYLGDLVAATSALRALRRGYPGAEISLISLPWAASLAPHLPWIDRVIAYPGAPGLEGGGSEEELARFLEKMRAERFDLAVNLHGRGPHSTRLVARFGARRTAGFANRDAPPNVEVPWDAEEHESLKLLLLAHAAGGRVAGAEPELAVRSEDERRVYELLPTLSGRSFVVLHPGASVPEKRWPAGGFGLVARELLGRGYPVVVTGSAKEGGLARRVRGLAPGVVDLTGRTDLSALISLVARADVLISNDTGPAHLAYALRTPSLTLFGPSTDARRWGPLNRDRHAVLFGDPITDISVGAVMGSVEALGTGREQVGA